MSVTTEWRVRSENNRLPTIAAGLIAAAALGVDRALAQVEQDAGVGSPFDTGGLRASRFRITMVTNEFSNAVGGLMSRNPRAHAAPEPSVDVAHGNGVVGFAADYAIPVHDGHHTRGGGWVPGRPFLAQAAEANRALIAHAIGDSLARLCRG